MSEKHISTYFIVNKIRFPGIRIIHEFIYLFRYNVLFCCGMFRLSPPSVHLHKQQTHMCSSSNERGNGEKIHSISRNSSKRKSCLRFLFSPPNELLLNFPDGHLYTLDSLFSSLGRKNVMSSSALFELSKNVCACMAKHEQALNEPSN